MRPRWSPGRLGSAAVLALWAAVFWFLLITARSSLYLSSRTDWLVPVGAAILTAAALGRAASARTHDPEPLRRGDAWGLAAVALPVVVVLALPPVSLGAFAAGRRSTLAAGGFGSSPEQISSGRVTLADVAGALRSRAGMKALRARAGTEVSFIGFVARESTAADEFELTRFLVSCCVADALSVQVRVVGTPPGRFKPDDWVRASGRLYPLGSEVILDADEVVGVDRPRHPYLNP